MSNYVNNDIAIEGQGVVQDPLTGNVALQSQGPSGNISIEGPDDYLFGFIDVANTRSINLKTGHNVSGNFSVESVSGEMFLSDRYVKNFSLTDPTERNLISFYNKKSIVGCLNEIGRAAAPNFAPPKSIGTENIEGVSGTIARSDHIHRVDNLTLSTMSPRMEETTTTLNGIKYLSNSSYFLQVFYGTATGYSVRLPNATTLTKGWKFEFYNNSTQRIILNYQDGTFFSNLEPGTYTLVAVNNLSTANGQWLVWSTYTATVASGLIYKDTSSATTTTTTSATYVDLANMSVTTEVAGYYLILFNCVTFNTNNGQSQYYIINVNGTDITQSERYHTTSGGAAAALPLQKVEYVNANQIIKIRWRRTGGTASTYQRTLTALKVG